MSIEHSVVLATTPVDESGHFPDYQGNMYLGGQIRMDAAVALAQAGDGGVLIATGGYNLAGDLEKSDKVDSMAVYIQDRVSGAEVRRIPSLPCTYHNFVSVFNTLKLSDELTGTIGIVTNGYHQPRAAAFAELAWDRIELPGKPKIVPFIAEEILDLDIESIRASDEQAYTKREQSEAEGLQAIQSGTYVESCIATRAEKLQAIIRKLPGILLTDVERAALPAWLTPTET